MNATAPGLLHAALTFVVKHLGTELSAAVIAAGLLFRARPKQVTVTGATAPQPIPATPLALDSGAQPAQPQETEMTTTVTAATQSPTALQAFIQATAAEFKALPFSFLVPLGLQLLQMTLAAELKSPTLAQLIISDIQSVINGQPSGLEAQIEAGAVSLVAGLVSGQSGGATKAQVVQTVTAVAAAQAAPAPAPVAPAAAPAPLA